VIGEDPWTPTHDPYAAYADATIAALQTAVSNGAVADRASFVSTYQTWRQNIATLELILQMRASVSVAEWGAFLQSKTRVINYLRQFMDARGWLKDAPIPPAVKDFIDLLRDLDVAFRFKQRAEALHLELNEWSHELTPRQQACLDMLILTDRLIRERLAQPAPAEKEDGFWDIAGDVVDVVIELSPIGDALDACRAITGKENCWSGRDLTTEERVASGLGVVIGSGAAWKAASSAVSAPAMGALRKVGDVLDELPPRTPKKDIIDETPHLGGAITYKHANGWEVRYTRRGFPDFSPFRRPANAVPVGKSKVTIEYSGNRTEDFKRANEKAFGSRTAPTPQGYVWHHHEDMKTMLLIREDVHDAFAHNGGVAVWQKVHGKEYK
jgi:hypothetical protein